MPTLLLDELHPLVAPSYENAGSMSRTMIATSSNPTRSSIVTFPSAVDHHAVSPVSLCRSNLWTEMVSRTRNVRLAVRVHVRRSRPMRRSSFHIGDLDPFETPYSCRLWEYAWPSGWKAFAVPASGLSPSKVRFADGDVLRRPRTPRVTPAPSRHSHRCPVALEDQVPPVVQAQAGFDSVPAIRLEGDRRSVWDGVPRSRSGRPRHWSLRSRRSTPGAVRPR